MSPYLHIYMYMHHNSCKLCGLRAFSVFQYFLSVYISLGLTLHVGALHVHVGALHVGALHVGVWGESWLAIKDILTHHLSSRGCKGIWCLALVLYELFLCMCVIHHVCAYMCCICAVTCVFRVLG